MLTTFAIANDEKIVEITTFSVLFHESNEILEQKLVTHKS